MRVSRMMLSALVVAALAIPVAAQFGPRPPQMQGMWNPVIGQGSAYELDSRDGKKQEMEIAVVGKEDYQGQPGFWLEMSFVETHGMGAMKMLMVMAPPTPGAKRMIMQMNGQAYEFPMAMMQNRPGPKPSGGTDITKGGGGTLVGTETITVPAGTFECQHYKANDPPGDVWVSPKVSPWGLVKSQNKDSGMVLVRVVTDAKDKITGPVKPFDPMAMSQQHP
jgi:hypothetical protein